MEILLSPLDNQPVIDGPYPVRLPGYSFRFNELGPPVDRSRQRHRAVLDIYCYFERLLSKFGPFVHDPLKVDKPEKSVILFAGPGGEIEVISHLGRKRA